MTIEIRELGPDDVLEWRAMRLRALTEEPDAFLSSAEQTAAQPVAELAARFTAEANVESPIFGAFRDGVLVGTAGLMRLERPKVRHTTSIWGVFVAPEARGLRLGDRLVAAAVDRARRMPGVERVTWIVTASNVAARRIYDRAGFVAFGLEPRALKIGDRSFDDAHMWLDLR